MIRTIFYRTGALAMLVAGPALTIMVSAVALAGMKFFGMSAARVQRFPAWWGRVICRCCGVKVSVVGRQHLVPDRPCILAANHTSQFDIFALQGYLDYDFRWLAKKELFRIPVFGPAMEQAGYIPVDRGASRAAMKSLTVAARRIAEGTSVVIFPEGTRSADGRLQRFKGGAMLLAIKAGVPIVPVGIRGTHRVLPKGRLLARPGEVTIRVGEPIDTTGFSTRQKGELAELVRQRVAELIDEGPAAGGATSS